MNTTLGLPIVRTSVDHGTALDIAGQGKADPGSLFEAVKLAVKLANTGCLTASLFRTNFVILVRGRVGQAGDGAVGPAHYDFFDGG